jgi:hypothetical protein
MQLKPDVKDCRVSVSRTACFNLSSSTTPGAESERKRDVKRASGGTGVSRQPCSERRAASTREQAKGGERKADMLSGATINCAVGVSARKCGEACRRLAMAGGGGERKAGRHVRDSLTAHAHVQRCVTELQTRGRWRPIKPVPKPCP